MSAPYLDDGDVVLYAGDCVEVMAELPAESVDAVVTDPPYALTNRTPDVLGCEACGRVLGGRDGMPDACPRCGGELARQRSANGRGFMGKEWDTGVVAFDPETWRRALRVLRPGGHLLAFGGTRTYHRLACAIEDAGFEIRDALVWLYGSGFPKGRNIGQEILDKTGDDSWIGWNVALKPGHEPIVVARKPLAERTVAAQVLATGTGAINVDGCRIEGKWSTWRRKDGSIAPGHSDGAVYSSGLGKQDGEHSAGRWPANVVLDEQAAALLDAEVGERTSGSRKAGDYGRLGGHGRYSEWESGPMPAIEGDTGGPSRFFYTAKAGADEREGSKHPTVKPLALMRWLVRLVTPPGVSYCPTCDVESQDNAAHHEGLHVRPLRGTVPVAGEGSALLLEAVRESAHSSEPCDDQGLCHRPEGLQAHSETGSSDGLTRGLRHGASASDGRGPRSDADAGRGGASPQRGQGGQPSGEPAGNAETASRQDPEATAKANQLPSLRWGDQSLGTCPSCGGDLATRPGVCLDPFAGSGTTLRAAREEGFRAIGIEREAEYLADAAHRLRQLSLFGEMA